MSQRTTPRRLLAAVAATGLILSACTAVEEDPETTEEEAPAPEESDETDAPAGEEADDTEAPEAGGEVQIGDGVTEEACPEAVNPDNGCIYLGVLSDLTEGPFAALAVPITDAQRAYWAQVNEAGGIAGFDVDIDTYTRDTKYQPAEHAAAYQQIEPNILAIAQSLGTVNTESVLDDMDANDIVAVPASWWSGYAFSANDHGLIMETGYSYCIEAMVGLDWFSENHGEVSSVAAVGYPGDYGGDSAAGAQLWAEANGVDDVTVIPTGPNQVTGGQDAVVSAVMAAEPDVVLLAVGPAENAEIVGKLAGGGFTGRFLGSLPTWNPALLDSAAAPALVGLYNHLAPTEQWDGTSAGTEAMKASLNGELPPNGGYIIGWVMSYPMHALLEKAAEGGDLTRAGLRAAMDGLEVDFDGMAEAITYGGEGADVAVSGLIVGTPNAEAPLGIETSNEFFHGPTFDQVDYAQACSASS
ncbi:ABC transporter substrate-binding protein [Ornithinimicrobium sp. F0845]|uniref:ABC transporter substrate-binding protein n=1 Tax=Ornithinimicrobium sp. F0845 TaxID=2926412 RepID=UPI001FF15C44|nr:ABC transporter substrate-binding protein [Ornithinimicrobium sp. F0845]MCK0111174.1 ABC transporter substrate-binding protein [Ornithinimicrobium sp. F0845]